MTPNRPIANQRGGLHDLMTQLANVLREIFGLEPKDRGRAYQKPYFDYFDQVQFPRGYRMPEFVKFSGDDSRTTLEHVCQFLLQCGEASNSDASKLIMFPLSLFGTAFT